MDSITADDARRLAVRAQGLAAGGLRAAATDGGSAAAGRPPRPGPGDVLRFLGAVQLDTISVLARSHELVQYARLGAVPRGTVEAAYWAEPAVAFEFWSHAACVLPVEEWPAYAVVRRAVRAKAFRRSSAAGRAAVLAALRERGPLTATDLGGAKRGGVWWDWSDVKIAAEELFDAGEVVVTRRTGWRRVYDLPERAIPADLLAADPPDDECRVRLLAHAGRRLGVATANDLARYFGAAFSVAAARALAADAGLVAVGVDGWRQPAWADPAALDALNAGRVGGRSRVTLLSPFDSLVWQRERVERVFGMRHRLEAYTPRERREHGYFAMPVLAGGRLVARVDPARAGRTLVARHVSLQPGAAYDRTLTGVATALREAAGWVGADSVTVERATPAAATAALRARVG